MTAPVARIKTQVHLSTGFPLVGKNSVYHAFRLMNAGAVTAEARQARGLEIDSPSPGQLRFRNMPHNFGEHTAEGVALLVSLRRGLKYHSHEWKYKRPDSTTMACWKHGGVDSNEYIVDLGTPEANSEVAKLAGIGGNGSGLTAVRFHFSLQLPSEATEAIGHARELDTDLYTVRLRATVETRLARFMESMVGPIGGPMALNLDFLLHKFGAHLGFEDYPDSKAFRRDCRLEGIVDRANDTVTITARPEKEKLWSNPATIAAFRELPKLFA